MADAADLVIKATDRATAPARNVANAFRGVADAARAASAAGTRLNAAGRVIDNHTGRFVKLGGAVEGAAGSMGGLSSLIGGVALGGVAASALMGIANAAKSAAFAVLELGAAFAKGVIHAAAFGERAELAFKLLMHGGSDSKAQLQRVIGLAGDLGLPMEETIKTFQKLLAMQFKPAMAEQLIKMGADLQAIGASSEEVAGALTAISQIKAKGRVQAEELLQLAERGVSTELVITSLGKALGKTNDQVRKLMEAGKISADAGIAAIGEAIKIKTGEKQFGEAGAKFATSTLTGMVNVFKSKGAAMMLALGASIREPLTKTLNPIVKDLMAALDSPQGKEALASITKGFTSVLGAIQLAWPVVKEFVGGLLEGLAPLKEMGAGMMDALGPVLELLGVDAKEAASGARLLGQALALVIGAATLAGGVLAGIVAVFVAIPVAIFKAGAAVGAFVANAVAWLMTLPGRIAAVGAELWNSAVQLGSSIIDGLVNGIQTGVGKVTSAVKGVGSAALSAFGVSIDAHSPSKAFETRGLWGAEGAARGFERGSTMVESASSKMGAAALGASWGGLGGNTTNRNAVSLTIQVQAPPGGSSAEDFAAQLGPAIRREVIGIFEDLAVQVGA